MNMKLIAGGALSGLVLAGGFAGMVSAQSVADATGLTEAEVIEIALMEVPGEVTEVELETHRGSDMYEIDILGADGVETEVKIAADTGDILKVGAEGQDCDDDQGRDGGRDHGRDGGRDQGRDHGRDGARDGAPDDAGEDA